MTPDEAEASRPRRRWLQFSLRTLLLLVVPLAALCGWFASKMNAVRRERRAVAAIRAMGGHVTYDWKYSHTEPPGPKWIRYLLGDDFFAGVARVGYPRASPDETLQHLDDLRGLRWLDLLATNVTDAGVERLAKHRELQTLVLRSTLITDEALPTLASMTELRLLYLDNTAVTTEAARTLKRLPNLEYLGLSGTHVRLPGCAAAPSEGQQQIAAALERWGVHVSAVRKDGSAGTEYWVYLYDIEFSDEMANLLHRLKNVRELRISRVDGGSQ